MKGNERREESNCRESKTQDQNINSSKTPWLNKSLSFTYKTKPMQASFFFKCYAVRCGSHHVYLCYFHWYNFKIRLNFPYHG